MRSYFRYISVLFVTASHASYGTEYFAPIPRSYPEAQRNFCGPSTAQSWIETLIGWSPSQYWLAYQYSGPLGIGLLGAGTNAAELTTMMNAYAGYRAGYNRSFYHITIPSQYQAEASLVSKIKNERRHVAIVSNVIDAYGNVKPDRIGGHWLLVWSVDISASSLNWVKVHDPLYYSEWMSDYQTRSLHYRMPASELWSKRWSRLPALGDKYQAVSWY